MPQVASDIFQQVPWGYELRSCECHNYNWDGGAPEHDGMPMPTVDARMFTIAFNLLATPLTEVYYVGDGSDGYGLLNDTWVPTGPEVQTFDGVAQMGTGLEMRCVRIQVAAGAGGMAPSNPFEYLLAPQRQEEA